MEVSKIQVFLLVTLLSTSAQNISSRYSRSISDNCGIAYNLIGHVFNGQETGRYEHPWKAALTSLNKDGSDFEYFCGGILIDDETIVTAAHCLVQLTGKILLPREITVMLGAHNIARRVEPGRIFAAVKTIRVHDKWNPSTPEFEGDIAILKLSSSVTMNEYIRPVCIADIRVSSTKVGVVAGWGVHDDTNMPSNIPRNIEIPILSDRECLKKNPGLLSIISEDLFCAGKDGAGVCEGDSGSGFYIQDRGRYYLRGIVSSSTNVKCSQSISALYSDILRHLDFIEKNSGKKNSVITTRAPIIQTTARTTRTKAFASFVSKSVSANCISERNQLLGYTCSIENLNVVSPNYRIDDIITRHEPGKTDANVQTLYIDKSNFTYFPTFPAGFIKRKFPYIMKMDIEGYESSFNLNPSSISDIADSVDQLAINNFGSKFTKLNPNLLSNCPNLISFYAYGNEIEEIPATFLKRTSKLRSFYVGKNRIKSFPIDLLSNLPQLDFFAAQENRISSLHESFFYQNSRLRTIWLNNNLITSLAENIFSRNVNLEAIQFHDNLITYFPEKVFANNWNLVSIVFKNNKIKFLPPDLIANCPSLKTFEVNENAIREIPKDFRKNNKKLDRFRVLDYGFTDVGQFAEPSSGGRRNVGQFAEPIIQ